MTDVQVHEAVFARVRVPAYLERSLQLALGGVHAPFFTLHDVDAIVVVLRDDEWARLTSRFASATVESGFRLVSVQVHGSDAQVARKLVTALASGGIAAAVLPSFHHDHLLVPGDQLHAALPVIHQVLGATPR